MNTIDSPLFGLSQRLPPSNVQAEQALLGALLANNKAYERVSEFLAAGTFRRPDPWPHLPGDLPPRRSRPTRRRRHPEGRIRTRRHPGGSRRHRLPDAVADRHGRHHQRRRLRPRDPRHLAAPPVDRHRRNRRQQRLRRRRRTRWPAADRGGRTVAVQPCGRWRHQRRVHHASNAR